MEAIIFTYGYSHAMESILNAIAALFNSALIDSLLTTCLFVGACITIIKASNSWPNVDWKKFFLKLIGIPVLFMMFISPKTSMYIYDHITKRQVKIDNLPLGFAAPVAYLEIFGAGISEMTEQAFSLPSDSFDYQNYGLAFGAQLLKEYRNFRISDPALGQNMNEFIKTCIVPRMGLQLIDKNDLANNQNIWEALKPKSETLTKSTVIENGLSEQVSCYQAARILEKQYLYHATNSIMRYKDSLFSFAGGNGQSLPQIFEKNLKIAFSPLGGSELASQRLIAQMMTMHSLKDWAEGYGALRARVQQEVTWKVTAENAGIFLPMLLTTCKSLIYGLFLIVVLMATVTTSFSILKDYFILVASFQIWPIGCSIVNMIANIYSYATFSDINKGVVFSTFSKIGEKADAILAFAGSLQIAVPILSFYILNKGYNGIASIASGLFNASIGGVSGAASMAAGEVTTGNKSFDNNYIGNTQKYNTSSYAHNENPSFSSGKFSQQYVDGSIASQTADGNDFVVAGAGVSKSSTGARFSMQESSQRVLSEQLSQQEAFRQTSQEGLNNSTQESYNNTISMIDDYAKSASKIEALAKQTGNEEMMQFAKNLNQYNDLVHNQGKSKESAFGGSFGVGKDLIRATGVAIAALGATPPAAAASGGTLAAIGAAIALLDGDIKASGSASTSDSVSKGFGVNASEQSSKNLSSMLRFSQDETFNEQIGMTQNHSDNLSKSLNDVSSYSHDVSSAEENIRSLQKEKSAIESGNSSFDMDITDGVLEKVGQELKIGKAETLSRLEAGDNIVRAFAKTAQQEIAEQRLDSRFQFSSMQKPQSFRNEGIEMQRKRLSNNLDEKFEARNTSAQEQIDSANNQISSSKDSLGSQQQGLGNEYAKVNDGFTDRASHNQKAIEKAYEKRGIFNGWVPKKTRVYTKKEED